MAIVRPPKPPARPDLSRGLVDSSDLAAAPNLMLSRSNWFKLFQEKSGATDTRMDGGGNGSIGLF